MSVKTVKQKEGDPFNQRELEDLFELFYRYSRVVINREISHSINNLLTSLSIQQSMLQMALRSGDNEKAMTRTEAIGKAVKNLEEFSASLATSIQILPKRNEVVINHVINDALKIAKELPSLENCKVSLDLCDNYEKYTIDVDSILILLLSFLKSSTSLFSIPLISIKTNSDSETGSFNIYAKAIEGQVGAPKEAGSEALQKVGSKLGEIPLRSVQRIVQSLNKNIELNSLKNGEFGFTCIITSLD